MRYDKSVRWGLSAVRQERTVGIVIEDENMEGSAMLYNITSLQNS